MKIKNKGKVHPSPSYSSSSCSVLKLLPSAILALVAVLSLEDREVLAYMIARSLKTTTATSTRCTRSPSSFSVPDTRNKKKSSSKKEMASSSHKPPVFDCDCFDCYTSYWFRWDSSPNRELIHQVIEAFEEHLTNGEAGKSKKNGKRRDKSSGWISNYPADPPARVATAVPDALPPFPEKEKLAPSSALSGDIFLARSPEDDTGGGEEEVTETASENATVNSPVIVRSATVGGHKCLGRKVLPDMLGLISSRLWGLWNPNA